MEFLSELVPIWATTLVWMAGLAVGFGVLSLLMPCNPGMAFWKDRRAVVTDAVYWLIVPFLLQFFRQMMLFSGVALLFGYSSDPEWLQQFFEQGYGPLSTLPIWAQVILVLLLEDIMLYWIHRSFHKKHLWPFHAVHHSSKQLDWISTQRFHPVNNLAAFGFADTVMLLIGFSPMVLIVLGPFNIIYSALVHANLNWTFGPFKYVLASPVFHRWHHTHPRDGGEKNFAPTFPILDVIFGTFYMPKGKLPESYGVTDKNFPEDFWGQFMYPFRPKKKG